MLLRSVGQIERDYRSECLDDLSELWLSPSSSPSSSCLMVNEIALEAVPPLGVTVTGTEPVRAPAGTLTVIFVLVQEETLAEIVPNCTTPVEPKPVP